MSGIVSENPASAHKVVNASGKEVVLQVPGRYDGGELTFKRGVTTNVEFWTWRQEVVTGSVATARVDGSIIMFNREYEEVRRWSFINAWPSKFLVLRLHRTAMSFPLRN